MAELKLINITKIFDKYVLALNKISFSVKDKCFFTILGPSGSGKSTILRIIAGLEKQNEGDVFIDGKNVSFYPPQKRDVAFVFQNYALYPHMDVEENITVGLRIKNYSKEEIRKRVEEVSSLLEIKSLLKRKPRALSGGQRQRVALARAIAKRPKVFLLDEPLSNLDVLLREKMRTQLKALFKRLKATVIYVTHDQEEAMALSDEIAVINNGNLIQIDAPQRLYNHPKNIFVASFVGSPRMNLFEVEIKDNNIVLGRTQLKIPPKLYNYVKKYHYLILGIRPEDVQVSLTKGADTSSAKLYLKERMGKYTILTLDLEGNILKAIVDNDTADKLREEVNLKFNHEKFHLFDRKKEDTILPSLTL